MRIRIAFVEIHALALHALISIPPPPMWTVYSGLHWGTNENCVTRVTLGDQWGRGPMRTYLLLLISMLWHRQAIFKSKGDELCSSAECRIWTQWDAGKWKQIWMVTLGDQWDAGLRKQIEMVTLGDHWDGRPIRIGYTGLYWGINENCITSVTLGDQWDGDQWELCNQGFVWGPMRWGTNENCVPRVLQGDQWGGDQWELCTRQGYIGGPMRRGPMRCGTWEMGGQWNVCVCVCGGGGGGGGGGG